MLKYTICKCKWILCSVAVDFLRAAAVSIVIIFLSILHGNNKNYKVIDNEVVRKLERTLLHGHINVKQK